MFDTSEKPDFSVHGGNLPLIYNFYVDFKCLNKSNIVNNLQKHLLYIDNGDTIKFIAFLKSWDMKISNL